MAWESKDGKPGLTTNPQANDEAAPWQPDESHDDFWGPDETEYWTQQQGAGKKDAPKGRASRVTRLEAEVIEWQQPDVRPRTFVEQLGEAHRTPLPLTYTVVDPSTDASLPENKRRLFGNLHAQLAREVDGAVACGSYARVDPDALREARGYAARPTGSWDDVEMATLDERLRELVRILIAKRREAEFSGALNTSV